MLVWARFGELDGVPLQQKTTIVNHFFGGGLGNLTKDMFLFSGLPFGYLK